MRSLPFFSENTNTHSSRGFRLWEIMLCSCCSVSEIWATFFGLSASVSSMAKRVGFANVEKNMWHASVVQIFVLITSNEILFI